MVKTLKNYIREIVYGGTDGVVTTFAVVTSAAGANLDVTIVLILGFASLVADAFSMGVSAYLSERSEKDSTGDSAKFSQIAAVKTGIATFLAFTVVGFVPLSVYTFDYVFTWELEYTLQISVGITLGVFAIIGLFRGIITNVNKLRTTLESFILGSVAAIVAYAAGVFLDKLIS